MRSFKYMLDLVYKVKEKHALVNFLNDSEFLRLDICFLRAYTL